MQCEEVREQFADYVIDQIEEPRRSLVARHLMVCENCRVEVEELKSLWETLGSIPAAEPSPELRSRFHLMLEAYRHGLDHAPKKSWWQGVNSWLSGWWPRQPVLQFGLSIGLLALGIMIGRQFHFLPVAPGVQPDTEVTELRTELS